MSQKEKSPRVAATFNEGEYLKNFEVIEDALEENMRAERNSTFSETDDLALPFTSIDQHVRQQLAAEKLDSPEAAPDQEPASTREVPFTSSARLSQHTPFANAASQPEAVLYRQARQNRRRRPGRQGIWRLLPHIGHRQRHWLQRNFPHVVVSLALLVAAAGYYLMRIRPQIVLATLDEMAGATQAHAGGDYDEAILLYQQFLQDSSESAPRAIEAHYYLGCCYENLGNEAKAQEEYRWVERAYDRFCEQLSGEERRHRQNDYIIPDVFANALYGLGQLAWQQGEGEQARGYFERLLEEFPDYFFALEAQEYLDRLAGRPVRETRAAGTPPPEAKGQSDGTHSS